MTMLEWNDVGEYICEKSLSWEKQNLNLPEFGQEVLIWFPQNRFYRDERDKYGRIIIGYFYLDEQEHICVSDGFDYLISGTKWAEFNRPSQPDKQVKICKNFACKKYSMRTGSKCNEVSCKECNEETCKNCKLYLSHSPKCENRKIW